MGGFIRAKLRSLVFRVPAKANASHVLRLIDIGAKLVKTLTCIKIEIAKNTLIIASSFSILFFCLLCCCLFSYQKSLWFMSSYGCKASQNVGSFGCTYNICSLHRTIQSKSYPQNIYKFKIAILLYLKHVFFTVIRTYQM